MLQIIVTKMFILHQFYLCLTLRFRLHDVDHLDTPPQGLEPTVFPLGYHRPYTIST